MTYHLNDDEWPPRASDVSIVSSVTVSSPVSEVRKPQRAKENEFVYKNGKRHHAHDPEKAPYPISYDADVMDLEAMDILFRRSVGYHESWTPEIVIGERVPRHVLDLGCGRGTWVLDAASTWTDTQFVGFDLVNIQTSLAYVDESISQRVRWIHGNFVSNRLPFEDDEFDHVRLAHIARGVPETKWQTLLDEVYRVLEPGGSVEVLEEDIIFPVLPLWFTRSLRPHTSRSHTKFSAHLKHHRPTSHDQPSPTASSRITHDHVLLEALFYGVFERRFINLKPCAIIPTYLSALFTKPFISPLYLFPMPPYRLPFQSDPEKERQEAANDSESVGQSPELSPSSVSEPPRRQALSSPELDSPSMMTLYNSTSSEDWKSESSSEADVESEVTPLRRVPAPTMVTEPRFGAAPRAHERLGSNPPMEDLFGREDVNVLHWHSLDWEHSFAHLWYTFRQVMACEEAMWEELETRLKRREEFLGGKALDDGGLQELGWDDDGELQTLGEKEGSARKKFDLLMQRYRSDMHVRLSLSHSLANISWSTPIADPLTRAEIFKRDRIRAAMAAIDLDTSLEKEIGPSRSARGMFGTKPA